MTTQKGNGHYPLVPAKEYLDLLDRYKDLPNIRPPVQAKNTEKNKPKEGFWKTLFSAKTLINVWMPTVMTVAGTLGGAVIGAKYNTPVAPTKHKPKEAIEKRLEHQTALTNSTTYVYQSPLHTNLQFAVVGQKGIMPKAYWITTNTQGLKEVQLATQVEQVVLGKE